MTELALRDILLAHGGGGQLTDELLRETILPSLGDTAPDELLDSATLQLPPEARPAGRVITTIDSFVVQPLQFPGGDIGRLAVAGTVNDLAMAGGRPLGLAVSLILAEGLDRGVLEAVLQSMRLAADEAGVRVVTGDTKVVHTGSPTDLFITTSGIGWLPGTRKPPHPHRVRTGDRILINGRLGDHGLAVMLAREMPEVHSVIRSDVAPLNGLIDRLLAAAPATAFLRDPTRSGVAGVVADLAETTGRRIVLEESSLPVAPETRHAAEMFGLDVLEIANEGKVVAVVPPDQADAALDAMAGHRLGEGAAVIGEVGPVVEGEPAAAELRTVIGGRRIIQKPYGEQLPRIC